MDNREVLALLKMTPENAVEYLARKTGKPSFWWWERWKEAQGQSFTAAKAMKKDVLDTLQKAVVKAMEEGQTEKQFAKGVYGTLDKLGWFGVRTDVDPATGKEVTHDIAPWRLELIARQNTQNAYQASHWQEMQDNRESRPWLQYVAVLESHTCETCESLDKLVLPIDDPFWETHYPPNHFNCRCSTRALTDEQKNERVADGRSVEPGEMKAVTVEQQVSAKAGHVTQTTGYEFNKGGKTFKSVPSAGFDTNVGMQGPRLGPPTDTAPPHAPTPAPAHAPVAYAPATAPHEVGGVPVMEPVAVRSVRPVEKYVLESPVAMDKRESLKSEYRQLAPLPKDPLDIVKESISSSNDSVADLVTKTVETARIKYHRKNISEYDHSTGTVFLSRQQMRSGNRANVVMHEIAHRIDTLDISTGTPVYTSSYIHSNSKRFAGEFDETKTKILENKSICNRIISDLSDKERFFDSTLSDLFGALTRNRVVGFFHHSGSYYKKDGTLGQEELFANMFTLFVRKDKSAWEYVEGKLPDLAKEFKGVMAMLKRSIEEKTA